MGGSHLVAVLSSARNKFTFLSDRFGNTFVIKAVNIFISTSEQILATSGGCIKLVYWRFLEVNQPSELLSPPVLMNGLASHVL